MNGSTAAVPLHPPASPSDDPLHHACADALAFLRTLDDAEPEQARARLPALRRRHPTLQIDLVWEREPHQGTLSYEVLLSEGGMDTVTVAYCPDRGIPWTMRGIQRHCEADLFQIDGTMVRIDQAIQQLDFIWDDLAVIHSLVDTSLLEREYADREIAVDDARLQAAMNEFRLRRGLRTRAQALDWLERHGLTLERLEMFVADRARRAALSEQVVGDQVETYFEAHRADFDRFVFVVVELPSAERAHAVARDADGTEDGLVRAARQRLIDADSSTHAELSLLQARRRWELPAALAGALDSCPLGVVIGPVEDDGVFRVACPVARQPATLDRATREHVERRLFDQWLTDRRTRADIEWFWGRPEKVAVP